MCYDLNSECQGRGGRRGTLLIIGFNLILPILEKQTIPWRKANPFQSSHCFKSWAGNSFGLTLLPRGAVWWEPGEPLGGQNALSRVEASPPAEPVGCLPEPSLVLIQPPRSLIWYTSVTGQKSAFICILPLGAPGFRGLSEGMLLFICWAILEPRGPGWPPGMVGHSAGERGTNCAHFYPFSSLKEHAESQRSQWKERDFTSPLPTPDSLLRLKLQEGGGLSPSIGWQPGGNRWDHCKPWSLTACSSEYLSSLSALLN